MPVGPEPSATAFRPSVPERGVYLGAIRLEGQTSMADFNERMQRPHALFDPADRQGSGADEVAIKQAWIRQVYNPTDPALPSLPARFPAIKAIVWFEQRQFASEVGGEVDWRLRVKPTVTAIYRRASPTLISWAGHDWPPPA